MIPFADLLDTTHNNVLRVSLVGFVDDINILTYKNSTECNCKILEETHTKYLHWAATHGTKFALEKYEILYFIKTPKKFNLKTALILERIKLNPKNHIKILGV